MRDRHRRIGRSRVTLRSTRATLAADRPFPPLKGQRVGWVERSETHRFLDKAVGFASLNPPYNAK